MSKRSMRTWLCSFLGCIYGFASVGTAVTAAEPPVEKKAPAKAGDKAAVKAADKAADSTSKKDKADEQKFVRVVLNEKKTPVTLQTAIVSYKATSGAYRSAEVDLIGAIHIADKAYFEKLNELFKTYDVVLYELVADPSQVAEAVKAKNNRSGVSAVQTGMKDMLGLSFQLDEIDYTAPNLVHADMNPEEFTQSLTDRKEGLIQFVMRSMGAGLAQQGSRRTSDLDVLTAMFSSNRELAMKRVLAEQMEQMDGQLAAISGDDGKSTLITERNAKALEVLKRELEAGKKKIGVFYGAGHFKHMDEELKKDFQLQPVRTEWLDAWDMK